MQDDNFSDGPISSEPHLPVPGHHHGTDKRVAIAPLRPHVLATKPPDDRRGDDPTVIDLRAYWLVLLKRRFQILGAASAVVAVALIWTLLTPSTYRATAVLQIDTEAMQVMQVQGITPVQGGYDVDYYNTQYELLKSRALAERVAEDLHLAGSDIFQRLQVPSLTERVRHVLRLGTPSQPKGQAGEKSGQGGASQVSDVADAAGLVRGGLVILPVRNTHLVRISYDSVLPSFSARVANAVADGFIASSLDRQLGASSYAKKYLEDQLAQLQSRLEESERALVEFAQKEKIVPTATGSSLVGQNLLDLNTSLAKAQDQRIRAESRWNQAKAAGDGALPADMLNDPTLRSLQENLGKIQADYRDKLQTFKPDYPTMLALKGQIDAVQDQVKVALANIRASVRAEYDAAAAQEKMLVAELSSLRTQTLEVDSRSIQYNILKRDADTNRQLYAALLQRYKEVGMAGGVKASNLSIVDRAEVPTSRFAPSLSRNVGAGALIGLMLGVMLALVLEHLDDTLKTPEDIEKKLHLAVLGIIPRLVKQSPDAALKDPRSSFSESYRSLRTALQFSTDRGVPKVLLITSPAANEGKSTTALTLARNFAQLGKRVLLIEGDLRRPSLCKTMGLPTSSTGLSNLLAGAVTAAQATLKTSDDRIDIMPSGPPPPSPTELLAGPKLISLLLTSAEKYDQVIIDGPPVLGIADAPILANASIGTLLVIRSRSTKIASAQSAMRRLKTTRARLIGSLLTQHEARTGGYGYYYYDTQSTYGPTMRLTSK